MNISDCAPQKVWHYFSEICATPHCSGNEQALCAWIKKLAHEKKWQCTQDSYGNILIRTQPRASSENRKMCALQAHLDMVCEKQAGSTHDFSSDPIRPRIVDGWITATDTTLGADNGIGLATALAAADDHDGPLELLFTVAEEIGLCGASHLSSGFIESTTLINLDSEENGVFYIGCAGGAECTLSLPVTRHNDTDSCMVSLAVNGCRGGHSGMDINAGRANAIVVIAHILQELLQSVPFRLSQMSGGNKLNAIPRDAYATVLFDSSVCSVDTVIKKVNAIFSQHKARSFSDESASWLRCTDEGRTDALVYSEQDTESILSCLCTVPSGVIKYHPHIPDLVETSNNIGSVHSSDSGFDFACMPRSSSETTMNELIEQLKENAESHGGSLTCGSRYPGWEPRMDSPVLHAAKVAYADLNGHEPEVKAIHAGLECGIIGSIIPNLDMISFGPTIESPHSPSELVHIDSVQQFYTFLLYLLKRL